MGKLVDKAAKRDDAYELVRLAYAFPEESANVDVALVQVAQRLGQSRKGEELAHILTLPEAKEPWRAVDALRCLRRRRLGALLSSFGESREDVRQLRKLQPTRHQFVRLAEPLAMRVAIRVVVAKQGPKAGRVVELSGVAELVQEHVVHHLRREEEQLGVQRDGALPRATPPARPLLPDGRPVVRELMFERKYRQAGEKRSTGSPGEPAAKRVPAGNGIVEIAGYNQRPLAFTDGRPRGRAPQRGLAILDRPLPPQRRQHDPLRQARRIVLERLPARGHPGPRPLDPVQLVLYEAGDPPLVEAAGYDHFQATVGRHDEPHLPRALAHANGVLRQSAIG